jgi:hypothetical protein
MSGLSNLEDKVYQRNNSQPSVVVPAMLAQDMVPYRAVPYNAGLNQGVAQFLTGSTPIPMQFGVNVPAYENFAFNPGDFSRFMQAMNSPIGEGSVGIPVYNPATGTYTTYESKSSASKAE